MRRARWLFCLLTLASVAIPLGCAQSPGPDADLASRLNTATPYPTYTPPPSCTALPTYTLYPTYTVGAVAAPPTCPVCPTCTVAPPPSLTPTPDRLLVPVIAVLDGDTIVVQIEGREERVRYLAIDCPEIAHEGQPAQWLGEQALAANAELVAGQSVWLAQDTPDRDGYGRLLRWVWRGQVLLNAELVRQGYARLGSNAETSRYAGLLHTAEAEAQRYARGVWAPTPTPTTRPTRAPTAAPTETPTVGPCNYVGNANSLIFHHAGCSSVAKMAESNKVCFSTRDEAIAKGYRPCKVCKP